MSKVQVDRLWRRIGADGLPPLAKNVFVDGTLIGRIVDAADYQDGGDTYDPAYQAEFFNGGMWFDAGTFVSFDAAFDRLKTGSLVP